MKPVSVEDTKAATDAAIAADPVASVGSRLTKQATLIRDTYPVGVRATLVHGIKRATEYQDVQYADEFLARVASVYELDLAHGDGSFRLTNEAARYTALWMTYEDTIRVAAIKVRARRFDRIHKEARVKNEQVVGIMEFLHPQVQEVADTLPTALGKWVLRSKPINALINRVSGNGIKVNTTSAFGYTTLYVLSRLRPIRRRSLRFNEEQLLIDAWLTTVMDLASKNYSLACEVAETQSLVKGYGETHANGLANFDLIMEHLPETLAAPNPVARIRQLREAALAEESGARLRALL
jgi:indolepyruvate ferredoxin oxidoreductase beta subunit